MSHSTSTSDLKKTIQLSQDWATGLCFLENVITIDYCNDWLSRIFVCCKNLFIYKALKVTTPDFYRGVLQQAVVTWWLNGCPSYIWAIFKYIEHFIFGSIILYNYFDQLSLIHTTSWTGKSWYSSQNCCIHSVASVCRLKWKVSMHCIENLEKS